jgi:hypothetical protein
MFWPLIMAIFMDVFCEGYVGTPTSRSASPSSPHIRQPFLHTTISLSHSPSPPLSLSCQYLLHCFSSQRSPTQALLNCSSKMALSMPSTTFNKPRLPAVPADQQKTSRVAGTQYNGRPLKSHRSIRCSYLKEYISFDH